MATITASLFITKSRLTRRLGSVDDDTLHQVCWSVSYALGC